MTKAVVVIDARVLFWPAKLADFADLDLNCLEINSSILEKLNEYSRVEKVVLCLNYGVKDINGFVCSSCFGDIPITVIKKFLEAKLVGAFVQVVLPGDAFLDKEPGFYWEDCVSEAEKMALPFLRPSGYVATEALRLKRAGAKQYECVWSMARGTDLVSLMQYALDYQQNAVSGEELLSPRGEGSRDTLIFTSDDIRSQLRTTASVSLVDIGVGQLGDLLQDSESDYQNLLLSETFVIAVQQKLYFDALLILQKKLARSLTAEMTAEFKLIRTAFESELNAREQDNGALTFLRKMLVLLIRTGLPRNQEVETFFSLLCTPLVDTGKNVFFSAGPRWRMALNTVQGEAHINEIKSALVHFAISDYFKNYPAIQEKIVSLLTYPVEDGWYDSELQSFLETLEKNDQHKNRMKVLRQHFSIYGLYSQAAEYVVVETPGASDTPGADEGDVSWVAAAAAENERAERLWESLRSPLSNTPKM